VQTAALRVAWAKTGFATDLTRVALSSGGSLREALLGRLGGDT
jgi:hypothetical protein